MDFDIELTELRPEAENNKSVFSRLPHYDMLMFLAISQKIKSTHFLEHTPRFNGVTQIRGANTLLQAESLSNAEAIVFKRIDPQAHLTEKDAFKALIAELVTHEHAVIRIHPNIHRIYGIAWEVHPERLQVLPVFAFQKSQLGDFETFLAEKGNSISFMQKLQLCLDVGLAIDNLHSINVVLGDVKPKNILVFEQGKNNYVARIIDFGCSSFGLDEQDSVTLSRTRGWEAPEYRRGTFTVNQAKKYDIYLYGKVCLWALLGQDLDVEGFLNPTNEAPIQYNLEAVTKALRRSESFQNEFWDTDRAIARLLAFFQASLAVEESEREGNFCRLLDQLRHSRDEFRSQQKQRKYQSRIGSFLFSSWELFEYTLSFKLVPKFDNMTKLSSAFALYRVDHALRRLWLNNISEDLSLGRRQTIFILAHSIVFAPTALAILCLWAATTFIFLMCAISSPEVDYGPSRGGIVFTRAYISFFCVVITARLMTTTIAQFLYHCFQEYRDSAHTFSLLWTKKHLIPSLPQLMPLLNRLHYQIRLQIVSDLTHRTHAVHGCDSCRRDAELQLALCHEVAFGVPRNTSRTMIGSSFRKLLSKVTRYDRRDRTRRDLEISYPEYFEQNFVRIMPRDQISNALTTRIYQEEIRGKEQTGLGLSSLPNLLKTLGDLSVRVGRYRGAEECYRKAISLTKRRCEGDLATTHAYSAIALGKLLEAQGRRDEAILVLETSTKPSMPYTWEIDFNIVLTRLHIAERRFDAVLRMNMSAMLAASGQYKLRQMNDYTVKAFCETLPMALLEEGRLDDAIRLQRQYVDGSTGDYDHAERTKDGRKLSLVLTMLNGDPAEVQEASRMVAELRGAYEEDDVAKFEIQPIQALILAKQSSQVSDALCLLRESLDAKKALVSRMDILTLGCMNHLADTLALLLEENEPLSMQFSLLDLAERINDIVDRASIITLMVTLSQQGCLDRSVKMIDDVLDAGILEFSDELFMQCHRAFILSTQGLAFENRESLDKALSIVSSVRSQAQVALEGKISQRIHIECIFASVLSKMHMLTRSHGQENLLPDFQIQAIRAHNNVAQMMTATWGSYDTRTIKATQRLAIVLAWHDLGRAKKIYEELLSLKLASKRPAKEEERSLKRTYARMHDASIIHVTKETSLNKFRTNQSLMLQDTVKNSGDDHPETMLERLSLANVYCMLGQLQEAEALVEKVRVSWCKRFGTRHQGLIYVRRALFLIHRKIGDNGIQLVSEISGLYYFAADVLGSKDHQHPKVLEFKGYLESALASSPFAGDEGFAVG